MQAGRRTDGEGGVFLGGGRSGHSARRGERDAQARFPPANDCGMTHQSSLIVSVSLCSGSSSLHGRLETGGVVSIHSFIEEHPGMKGVYIFGSVCSDKGVRRSSGAANMYFVDAARCLLEYSRMISDRQGNTRKSNSRPISKRSWLLVSQLQHIQHCRFRWKEYRRSGCIVIDQTILYSDTIYWGGYSADG